MNVGRTRLTPAEHRLGIAPRWQSRARSVARATVADLCAGRWYQRDASIRFPVNHRALRARSARREPSRGWVRLGGRVRARGARGIARQSCSKRWLGPRCWLSGHWRHGNTRVGVGTWSVVRGVWITIINVDQCARAARPEPREAANGNGPTRRAGPIVQTALAGYSARAPCPHPASQSHPSPGRPPAR